MLKNILQNINPLPFLKQGINNNILRRSGRELSQELLNASVVKPLYTDNWDLVIELDLENIKEALKDLGSSFVGSLNSIGNLIESSSASNILNAGLKGAGNKVQSLVGGNQLATAKKQSTANLIAFFKSAYELADIVSNTFTLSKLSVRTTHITIPTYKVDTGYLKFGPLRYHYPIDFSYDGAELTIREDEDTPLYPIFEKFRDMQISQDTGFVTESGKARFNLFMTIYSDYTSLPFLTFNMFGCRVTEIAFAKSGGFDRGSAVPLEYTIKLDVDDFRIQYNSISPIVNLASSAIPVNKFLNKIGSTISNLKI